MLHHVLVMPLQQAQRCPAAQLPASSLRQRPVQRLGKEGLDASSSPAAAHWPRCPLGTAAAGRAAQL